MSRISASQLREEIGKEYPLEDETNDLRNILNFSETAIPNDEIDGQLWRFQLRKADETVGGTFNRQLNKLPIISANIKANIQDYLKKAKFGEVKALFLLYFLTIF